MESYFPLKFSLEYGFAFGVCLCTCLGESEVTRVLRKVEGGRQRAGEVS